MDIANKLIVICNWIHIFWEYVEDNRLDNGRSRYGGGGGDAKGLVDKGDNSTGDTVSSPSNNNFFDKRTCDSAFHSPE